MTCDECGEAISPADTAVECKLCGRYPLHRGCVSICESCGRMIGDECTRCSPLDQQTIPGRAAKTSPLCPDCWGQALQQERKESKS